MENSVNHKQQFDKRLLIAHDKIYSINQIADILELPYSYVYSLLKQNCIDIHHKGRYARVLGKDILFFIDILKNKERRDF